MLQKIKFLLERTDNINRSTYIWNAVNAIMSALESPVILIVLNRTNGLEDAGVFSIAFAVATLLLYLGQYGFRRFQSSDISEKYTFEEYYGARFLTCGAMIIAALAYCIYGSIVKGYTVEKFAVILVICLIKGVQAFSDVIHGRMQQLGRLDVATKSSCTRYIAEILSFCLTLIFTHNLLAAALTCFAVSIVVFMLTSYNAARDFCSLKPCFEWQAMKRLLVEGFPLFVSLFLNMYISNAPKYAIDAYLSDEIQALYNMVFMPAFVIQLIAHFIFNPIITTYAEVWQKGDKKRFRFLVLRQCAVILGLTVLAVLVALTIGIPVLGWIFDADLSSYKTELCIVCIGGGFLAYSVFFNTIITIVRLHKVLFYTYGVAALAALLMSKYFVVGYGIMGAVILYAVIIALLAVLLAVISFIKIERYRAEL